MAVVQVEGQLIVGNRQELKDLVQAALDARRAPDPDRLLPHRLHRLLRARRAGLDLQADPRGGRRAPAVGPQRRPPLAVRADQARHALRHRRDAPAGPRELLAGRPMPSPLRLCVRRSPAADGRGAGDAGDAAAAERGRLHRGGGGAGHPPLPGRSRRSAPRPGSGCRWCSREALSNAIMRGNREDRGKWVDIRAELGPDAIRLEVTDEGPGFDPDRGARADPPRAARRGQWAGPLPHPEARGRGPVQRARELHLHDTAPSVGRLDLVRRRPRRTRRRTGAPVALRRARAASRRRRRSRASPAVPRAAGLTPTPGGHRLARAGGRGRRASGSRSAGPRRGRAAQRRRAATAAAGRARCSTRSGSARSWPRSSPAATRRSISSTRSARSWARRCSSRRPPRRSPAR